MIREGGGGGELGEGGGELGEGGGRGGVGREEKRKLHKGKAGQLEGVPRGCRKGRVVLTLSPAACSSSRVELFEEEMGKWREAMGECGSLTGGCVSLCRSQ